MYDVMTVKGMGGGISNPMVVICKRKKAAGGRKSEWLIIKKVG